MPWTAPQQWVPRIAIATATTYRGGPKNPDAFLESLDVIEPGWTKFFRISHGLGGGMCGFFAYGMAADVPELFTRNFWAAMIHGNIWNSQIGDTKKVPATLLDDVVVMG